MAKPTLSPDGNWLWTGEEWVPAPPTSPPNESQGASNQQSEFYENAQTNDSQPDFLTTLISKPIQKSNKYQQQPLYLITLL